ncbi:MAG: type I-E CRISPR-associated protein Cas7/Cse4/CasC [Candidatus Latescibacteria bacterium]|nr:type I-E CRISPR-associated protein Cas7/Cse4/CasC [Candidatus Latescibacterota bacterium]
MKLIELHIIQSFPVTCLNRDDLNAPKTAFFGGVQRARVSSQSWKRAIREIASKIQPALFDGKRSHYFAKEIEHALEAENIDSVKAKENAEKIAKFIGDQDSKYKEGYKTSVALYLTPNEVAGIAKMAAEQIREKGEVNLKTGTLKKAILDITPGDMADIAVFGRMVAKDHTLMVEGAGLFSHALSTHGVSNDIDFFSAVDDLLPETSEGAGHIGTLEFNSACYYRYIGLNLDLLADQDHLKHLSEEERDAVVDTFIRASVLAVPNARKNSMFGHNPPAFVLGLKREGQPLSLANAFEGGIKSSNGYIKPSVAAIKGHYETLKKVYGIEAAEAVIPDMDLNSFCEAMTKDADQ